MDIQLLFKQLLNDFYNSTTNYARMVKNLNVVESSKEYFTDLLMNLDAYIQNIDAHQKCFMQGISLTSINVCQYLNSFFTKSQKKKNKKTVKYYIQYGFDGPVELVKDTSVLVNEFNIENCIPLMSVALFQLADNALKYMPKNSCFSIELRITNQQKCFRFRNYGPSLLEEEEQMIMEPSTRGAHAQDSRNGLGLGLYETSQIVNLHKWIDATFDIEKQPARDNTRNLNIDGIPQSEFISTIQFNRQSSFIPNNENALEWLHQHFNQILIHDMYQIIINLIDLSDRIEKLQIANGDYSWRYYNQRYRTHLNLIHDKINLCNLFFYGFDCGLAIDQVTGNNRCVPIRLQSILHITLKNLNSLIYEGNELEIIESGKLQNRPLSNKFWTFITGFLDLLLSILPEDCNRVHVEYLSMPDNKRFCITYEFENFTSKEALRIIKSDDELSARLDMYQLMCDIWEGGLSFEQSTISITLPYQQAS